jgi:acetyl-CoA acetyltransferases
MSYKDEAYIVAAARSPIGSLGGSLASLSAAELGTRVARAAIERSGLPAESIDEAVLGCVLQAGCGQNVARQVAIRSGARVESAAVTVNMVCGSGLRAVALAAQAIRAGDASVVLAGGTESMSRSPYLLREARAGYRMGSGELVDSAIADGLWDSFGDYHMGITAENVAARYMISREEQDEFAAASQNKAEAAIAAGRFAAEIVPVAVPQRKGPELLSSADESPRQGVTPGSLARLKPAFKPGGTVTAGNASSLNDGAAMLLLCGGATLALRGLAPLARVVSYAWRGCDPAVMGLGPIEAAREALRKAGWRVEDLDLVEANEAFASQAIAVSRELGIPGAKLNVNGGAIALGHPIGASGARILVTLIHEMARRGARRGLATLCIGGGMGIALCVERTEDCAP